MLETRSSSPWICAFTPLGPSSRISLEIFLASSEVIPSLRAIAILETWPDWRGSEASRIFRLWLRLTSFCLKTSRTALARSSAEALISIASLALPLDGGAGALEVEAGGDLAGRLAQRVVDLLAVDLAHDVERAVGHRTASWRFSGLRCCLAILPTARAHRDSGAAGTGRLPERPMGADCKSVGLCLPRFESWICHHLETHGPFPLGGLVVGSASAERDQRGGRSSGGRTRARRSRRSDAGVDPRGHPRGDRSGSRVASSLGAGAR